MAEDNPDYLILIGKMFSNLWHVFAELFPVVLFSFILASAAKILASNVSKKFMVSFVELCFFSFVGVGIAYVVNLSQQSVVAGLLPSLVIGLGFFFNLFARSKMEDSVPIGSREAYLAAFVSIISFLVASRYFEVLN